MNYVCIHYEDQNPTHGLQVYSKYIQLNQIKDEINERHERATWKLSSVVLHVLHCVVRGMQCQRVQEMLCLLANRYSVRVALVLRVVSAV